MSTPTVRHDADGNRFVAELPEGEAYLGYHQMGENTLDLQHTIVPEAARGRGVGESLVAAAMQYARTQQWQVVPTCPFVKEWLNDHPEAQDLVAVGG